jgi:hypothetical protein
MQNELISVGSVSAPQAISIQVRADRHHKFSGGIHGMLTGFDVYFEGLLKAI